jgi:hypothetical protein
MAAARMRAALARHIPLVAILEGAAWQAAPLAIYFLYRAAACADMRWECRAKTSRQTFEDVTVLLLLSLLLHLTDGLEPCEEPPPPPPPLGLPGLAAAHASSGSEEDGAGGAAKAAALPRPPAAPAPRAPCSACACACACARPLLLALGFSSAVVSSLVMGALGGPFPFSLDTVVRPPALWLVAPFLALVAACTALGALSSWRAGAREFAAWLAVAVAAAAYYGVAASISRGPAPLRVVPCDKLVYHPHHYALALIAAMLLRRHGLSARSSLCGAAVGAFVYTTKCALVGIFIQGLAQYGPDSILRSTSCATS